jgi:hypothetical protein
VVILTCGHRFFIVYTATGAAILPYD